MDMADHQAAQTPRTGFVVNYRQIYVALPVVQLSWRLPDLQAMLADIHSVLSCGAAAGCTRKGVRYSLLEIIQIQDCEIPVAGLRRVGAAIKVVFADVKRFCRQAAVAGACLVFVWEKGRGVLWSAGRGVQYRGGVVRALLFPAIPSLPPHPMKTLKLPPLPSQFPHPTPPHHHQAMRRAGTCRRGMTGRSTDPRTRWLPCCRGPGWARTWPARMSSSKSPARPTMFAPPRVRALIDCMRE